MVTYFFTACLLIIVVSCNPIKGTSDLNFSAPNAYNDHLAQLNYTSDIQMADRSYVESVLLQVFNAKGTPSAAYIQSDIFQRKEFGGPCDLYSASEIGGSIEFPREQCFSDIGAVQTSTNNPMRYSMTIKVCEKLILEEALMGEVRSKIFGRFGLGREPASDLWPAPDSESIKKAWGLFFQTQEAHPEMILEFQKIANVSGGSKEAWENIILTMCISPEWQVL